MGYIFWGNWNNNSLFGSIFLDWNRSHIFKKLLLKTGIKGDMKLLRGDLYVLEEDLEKLRQIAIESLENNGAYHSELFRLCDQKTEEFRQLEGKNELRTFILLLVDYAGITDTIELTAWAMDSYFKEKVEQSNYSFTSFMAEVRPLRKSLIMQFLDEINTVKEENMDSFIQKFRWVGTHGLEGGGLTKKRVEEILRDGAKRDEEKVPSQLPGELSSLSQFISALIFYRANIIETMNLVAFSYRGVMAKLAQKHNLSYDDLLKLTWYEFVSLIDAGILPNNFSERSRCDGLMYTSGKYNYLLGENLDKEMKKHSEEISANLTEVKGMPAHSGIVRGRVCIIKQNSDVEKVNQGDIIVATETTVDYIAAMKRASAFVTNQGGITSHAAVMARELQKPCIVGTKIATKIFKDGDLVEVDANKGVVRKIK